METAYKLTADSDHLAAIRKTLEENLAKAGLKEKPAQELILAVNEALANVIRHSYAGKGGEIELYVRNHPDRIEILIREFGKSFDPDKVPQPQIPPSKPGGLGVFMIRKLTDACCYTSTDGVNELLLTKLKS